MFRVPPLKSGSLSGWRDWQTPTLTEGGGTPGDGGGPGNGGDPGDGGGDPGDGGGSDGTCTARYETLNTWSGGFQGEVTVRNAGSSALTGWTVGLNLAPGQSISSLWNGEHSGTSGLVTVRNTSWNGPTAPGATAVFGFTATGSSTAAPSGLTRTGR